jgi:hypothetical protein
MEHPAPVDRTRTVARVFALFVLVVWAAAAEVVLQAPLTTRIPAGEALPGGCIVQATLTVPVGAPADLGVGAYMRDKDGRWYQRCQPGTLRPGRHRLALSLTPADALAGEGHGAVWTTSAAATMHEAGIFLWSAGPGGMRILVDDLRVAAAGDESAPAAATHRLLDLDGDGAGPAGFTGHTGQRWEVRCRPDPWPANPYDDAEFALDAEIRLPDGTIQRVPGFHRQAMAAVDRGDREAASPVGAAVFALRLRPRQPGVHTITLVARWRDGREVRSALPPLTVGGPAWDGFVRVDAKDPRFFATGDGALVWPIGVNMRSVNDTRGRDRMRTALTPDRGIFSYDAFLRRFHAAGVDAIEIWMASWNVALEWTAAWPGYHGVGRYNEANAERLDRILDTCESLGMRVNLVLNNHGQASPKSDREWPLNPYNRASGGRLDEAADLFTDRWAEGMQRRVRRYIVARYADSPTILGWKLYSEVNLTAGRGEPLRLWLQAAAEHLAGIDSYGHPATIHWSGDYRTPDRTICALPGMAYICLDAYRGRTEQSFAELITRSTLEPGRGLSAFAKPVLVTEYGGNWDGGGDTQVQAEHASAAWAGIVSGHAGAPMIWWWEWVDQGERWDPYRAARAFLAGEDLRGADAASAALSADSAAGRLWARAWVRPGRLLGYVLDQPWGASGGEAPAHSGASVVVGEAIKAGRLDLTWWDGDTGTVVAETRIDHPGGRLTIQPPSFRRHIAFKLIRWTADAPSTAPDPAGGR